MKKRTNGRLSPGKLTKLSSKIQQTEDLLQQIRGEKHDFDKILELRSFLQPIAMAAKTVKRLLKKQRPKST